MRYNFRNTETGEIIEKIYPMSEVPSSFEENGVVFKRDFMSEGKHKATIIPEHMKAGGTHSRIMRGNRKSPSGRKNFY